MENNNRRKFDISQKKIRNIHNPRKKMQQMRIYSKKNIQNRINYNQFNNKYMDETILLITKISLILLITFLIISTTLIAISLSKFYEIYKEIKNKDDGYF